MATKVQSATPGTATGGATLSATISGVTGGNTLVITIWYLDSNRNTTVVPTTPTDSNGTLSVAIAPTCASAGVSFSCVGAAIYYVPNANAGSHTITFTPASGAVYGHMTIDEWSGLGSFDKSSSSTNNSAASSTSGSSGTTATLTNANEIVFVATALASNTGLANAGISDPPTGYASLYADQDTAVNVGTEIAWKSVSSTAAVSATWSWTADSSQFTSQGVIATFVDNSPGGSLPLMGQQWY